MARELSASDAHGNNYMTIYVEEARKAAVLELGGLVTSTFGVDGEIYLHPGSGGRIGKHESASIALSAGENTITVQEGQPLERPYVVQAGQASHRTCTISPSGIALAKDSKTTISLDANVGNIRLGGSGTDGDILLFPRSAEDTNKDTQASIWLDADQGNLALGGNGIDGDLLLFPNNAKISTASSDNASIHLDAADATIWLGGKATSRISLQANNNGLATLRLGGHGCVGDVKLFPSNSTDTDNSAQARIWLDAAEANLALGGNGKDGDIMLFRSNKKISTKSAADASIHLDGENGDIILSNSDCAEDFDILVSSAAEPGAVMVIAGEGSLRTCTQAYDKKVAGVISGAGDLRPGILLGRQPGISGRMPLALMGKVYCKVDAQYAPIEVGDLLTTSPTEGHAMKATDPAKAFGAVIGKALKPMKNGQGMLPIMVALQ